MLYRYVLEIGISALIRYKGSEKFGMRRRKRAKSVWKGTEKVCFEHEKALAGRAEMGRIG